MNIVETQNSSQTQAPNKSGGAGKFFKTLGIIVFSCVLTAVLTVVGIKMYLFPGQFKPVELTQKEERVLEEKLTYLKPASKTQKKEKQKKTEKPLEPVAYSEANAIRKISFTEREINAVLAKNTDLATKLAIDLEQDLASARLRLPLDPDMPIVGGKTLKASAGLELRYDDGKPVVVLKGVMLWGVPIPNAWLGNLKNIDLVQEFDGSDGFWKDFSNGIKNIAVEKESITVEFKE